MNIVITKLEGPYVSFTSNYGKGKGIGHVSQQFDVDRIYSVEFNFSRYLNTNENTKIGTTKEPGFYCEENNTLIVAIVENVDEDDEVCLRIAPDCMIIADRDDNVLLAGDRIEIRMFKDEFIITWIGVGKFAGTTLSICNTNK